MDETRKKLSIAGCLVEIGVPATDSNPVVGLAIIDGVCEPITEADMAALSFHLAMTNVEHENKYLT